MLHAIGDSHVEHIFKGFGMRIDHVGPVTLRRIVNPEEQLLYKKFKVITTRDIVFLSFGEIDVRCHIPQILADRSIDPKKYMETLAEDYAVAINAANINKAQIVIVSLPPPAKHGKSNDTNFPAGGTQEERVKYTRMLNREIHDQCYVNKYIYLDMYTPFANKEGVLDIPNTKDYVHIDSPAIVEQLLMYHGFISRKRRD